MAVEPGGLKDQLVTAGADGELKFIDFRVLGEGKSAGSSGESAFAMRPPTSSSGSSSSGESPMALIRYCTVCASPSQQGTLTSEPCSAQQSRLCHGAHDTGKGDSFTS